MNSSAVRRLEGKVAVVTGAGRGIGRAESLLFAQQGASVVVNDLGGGPEGGGRDESLASAVVDEIKASGGDAVANTVSVSDMSGGAAVIEAALDAFGRIDILSNNAGVVRAGRIDQMSEEDFDVVIAVNLKGYFATIRAAAPHFIRQRGGVIISKSSASAFGQYGVATYAAAKEGVVGLTRSVARDLGQFGVRCNVVRPTARGSNMGTTSLFDAVRYSESVLKIPTAWNRYLDGLGDVKPAPEHVAALTVWLCTDACKEVNGREFFVAGSEVGVLPEPELARASFKVGGWDLDSFDEPARLHYLIGDIRNRFGPRGDDI